MYKTKGFILHIKTICIKIRDFRLFQSLVQSVRISPILAKMTKEKQHANTRAKQKASLVMLSEAKHLFYLQS